MIREVELELKTISEANAREFWRVRAGRRADQRDIVGKALREEFGGARPLFDQLEHLATGQSVAKLGQVVVELTRLAPGELDADENLPMSFKAIKDEIADWLGLRTDRDKRVRWSYRQERSAAGVYKIRIAIRDGAPGPDIRVQRATQAEHEAGALQRMYPKGKPPAPRNGQAALPFVRAFAALPWEAKPCAACRGTAKGRLIGPLRDLVLLDGDERGPIALVCAFCGGEDGEVSWAAREDVICAECKWSGTCTDCEGTGRAKARMLIPLARFTGLDDPPRTIEWRVPREHLARIGRDTVTLQRRTFRSKTTGRCWLYETTSPHAATNHDTKEN